MDAVTAIKERRSINYFDKARELDDALLREAVALANLAPSSMNLQPWRAIAVKSREKKKALRACAMDQEKVEEASAVLIVIADPAGLDDNIDAVMRRWIELGYMDEKTAGNYRGFAPKLYGGPETEKRRLFAVRNASFFAMSFMIAAKGLGLETHPMDGFDEARIKKEFNIGEDKIIPVIIAVGWLKPGAKLLPRAYRRDLNDFLKVV